MIRWLLMSLGTLIWGSAVYSAGVAVSFPGDVLAKRIAYEVQERSRKEFLVDIQNASFQGLGGIGLDQVTLYSSKRGRRSPGQKSTPVRENTEIFSVDQIDARPRLLSLLTGTLMADFGMTIPSGEIEGAIGMDRTKLYVESDTEGIDLAKVPFILEDGTLDLSGELNFLADLVFDQTDIKQSSGELRLTVDDLTLNSGTISGFTLSETTFSEAELTMEVDEGKATVTKGSFVGDLLDAKIDGYITLNKSLARSRLNLKIEIRFDETLDKFAQIALKRSRDDDGVYHFRGSGTITNPRFRADRSHSSRRGRNDILNQNNNDDDANNDVKPRSRRVSTISDEEREERREKRRERLKKRRERMKQRREERRLEARSSAEEDDFEAVGGQEYDDEDEIDANQGDEYEVAPNQYEEVDQQGDYDEYDNANGNENLEDMGYIDE